MKLGQSENQIRTMASEVGQHRILGENIRTIANDARTSIPPPSAKVRE